MLGQGVPRHCKDDFFADTPLTASAPCTSIETVASLLPELIKVLKALELTVIVFKIPSRSFTVLADVISLNQITTGAPVSLLRVATATVTLPSLVA